MEYPALKGAPEGTITLEVNGQEQTWRLTANLLAWAELKKNTGKDPESYAMDASGDDGLSKIVELAWAFSASYRKATSCKMSYEDFLEALPADEEGVAKIADTVTGMVLRSFLGKTLTNWAMRLIHHLVTKSPEQTGTTFATWGYTFSASRKGSSGKRVASSTSESLD